MTENHHCHQIRYIFGYISMFILFYEYTTAMNTSLSTLTFAPGRMMKSEWME